MTHVTNIGDRKWSQRLLMTAEKPPKPKKAVHNIVVCLEGHPQLRGRLAWNAFTSTIMKIDAVPWGDAGPWDEGDDIGMLMWLEVEIGRTFQPRMVRHAVHHVARENEVHPVREWLTGLRWDGEQRLPHWLADYLGAEEQPESYLSKVGIWWMVSAVARVMRPGCQADHVLVLEGDQGLGKSSAVGTLAGPDWFDVMNAALGDKDSYMKAQGRWIVELDELAALRRAEIEKVKSFVTTRSDRFRRPYGAAMEEVPRQCVFVGTTNAEAWMADATGGRRWWPVRCGAIDLEGLATVRNQLWAEAVARYDSGEHWWPAGDDRALLATEVEERAETDPWESKVQDYVQARDRVTTADLLGTAVGKETGAWTKADQMRVGSIMTRLGWRRKRSRNPATMRLEYAYFKNEDREAAE